eukprot:scaffold14019_cov116-Cylindrotheca_fusiformis.AAC.1
MEDALGRSYFQPDLSFCTNDFVRRALTPDVWDVGPIRSISMATQGQSFSPLAFNVALNSEYPIATLPPAEWARLPGFPAINEVWQQHQRCCSA